MSSSGWCVLGHRSAHGEGSSRSRSDRTSAAASSGGSYRTVVDSRDKDRRSERSRSERDSRKSRGTKKEKDRHRDRKRYL